MGAARLQLRQLSARTRSNGATDDLRQVLGRSGAEGCVPENAGVFDDHERTHRGRGHRADLYSRRLRGDPSGGRKLGRSRHYQKESFCGWGGLIFKRDEHEWAPNGILSDDGCATPIERSTTKGNARTEPNAKLEGRWEGVSKRPSILSIWWFRSPR